MAMTLKTREAELVSLKCYREVRMGVMVEHKRLQIEEADSMAGFYDNVDSTAALADGETRILHLCNVNPLVTILFVLDPKMI